MNTKKKILLLGGTGAMGAYLVELLSQRDDVFCYVTSRSSRSDLANIKYLQGNAQDSTFLHKILDMHPWDCVVDFMVYSTEQFRERANLLLQSTKQYIFISSARVYADSDGQLTEESPRLLDVCTDLDYLSTDEYALTKARQEDILIKSDSKNWTIVRPYITFSDNRLQLGVMEKEMWLIPALNNRPIVFSNDIAECDTTMTDGCVLAQCLIALMNNSAVKGEIFHIASEQSYKWKEILEWYLEVFEDIKGTKPSVHFIEKWDCRLGGEFYQWKYDRLYNRKFNNTKICKFVPNDIFLQTEQSIKTAISKYIKSYSPDIKHLNQNVEFARGIITGQFLPIQQVSGTKRKLKVIAQKIHIYKLLQRIYHGIKVH